MNEPREDAEAESGAWKRKTFSLPTSIAEYLDHKAPKGGASAYVAKLIEADRHRELAREELASFGYAGDLEITDEGRASARARLDSHKANRAARDRRNAA
jgi:hypothetical protein